MTAAQLKQRLLRIVSRGNGSPSANAVDDVVQAVNEAYQILWLQVPRTFRTHYTRREDSVALEAGTNTYTLAEDVQAVLPPVRLTVGDRPLTPADHKSEVINYGLVRGSVTASTTNARPRVYFCESLHQAQDDATRVKLIVAPTPAAAETLDVAVELSAPSFTAEDFCSETPPALRIPHAYVESLLFPVAAYLLASRSSVYARNAPQGLDPLQKNYERALRAAGVSDPAPTSSKAAQKTGDT